MAAPVFVLYGDVTHNENIHILLFDIVNEITYNQAVFFMFYNGQTTMCTKCRVSGYHYDTTQYSLRQR